MAALLLGSALGCAMLSGGYADTRGEVPVRVIDPREPEDGASVDRGSVDRGRAGRDESKIIQRVATGAGTTRLEIGRSDVGAPEVEAFDRELRIAASGYTRSAIEPDAVRHLVRRRNLELAWIDAERDQALSLLRSNRADFALITVFPGRRNLPAGLESEPIGDHVVAVLRDPDVDVAMLTTEQSRQIVAGRYLDWSRVGGRSGSIVARSTELAQHTVAAFGDLLSVGFGPQRLPDADQEVVDFVASTPGAIGFIDLASIERASRSFDAYRLIVPIDGVAPTLENFRRGHYPAGRRIVLVRRSDADPAELRLFAELTAPSNHADVAPRLVAP